MPAFEISQPEPDLVRVFFPASWDATAESEAMFKSLLETLNDQDNPVTLMVVAGGERPEYSTGGLHAARDILFHDNIARMVIVADDPSPAVSHMSAFRGERGLPPIPMIGASTEEEARQQL
ncbi:MAG: hypothetical protein GYB66_00185 [Chloroflexi bacterium]|nr:hypothetical protein [Chloroflexota bacterium]